MKKFLITAALKKAPIDLDMGDGSILPCEIREFTASQSDDWGAYYTSRVRADDNGKKLKAELICRSIFVIGKNAPLTMDEVMNFSSTAQNALYEIVMDFHGFTNASMEAAKVKLDEEKKN